MLSFGCLANIVKHSVFIANMADHLDGYLPNKDNVERLIVSTGFVSIIKTASWTKYKILRKRHDHN